MCKAEKLAEEYAKNFILTVDHLSNVEEAFRDGYEQAEEDLVLTWKDLALIRLAFDATESNINHGSLKISKMTKEYYQEVLKRFKDLKK